MRIPLHRFASLEEGKRLAEEAGLKWRALVPFRRGADGWEHDGSVIFPATLSERWGLCWNDRVEVPGEDLGPRPRPLGP